MLKNKKNIIFSIIAGILAIALIYIVVKSLGFMKETIDSSLGYSPEQSSGLHFEFEKLRETGIIKN